MLSLLLLLMLLLFMAITCKVLYSAHRVCLVCLLQ
jgi:hypothetical protein